MSPKYDIVLIRLADIFMDCFADTILALSFYSPFPLFLVPRISDLKLSIIVSGSIPVEAILFFS
jgi:hypothetical protein